jgi:hypothetical protein
LGKRKCYNSKSTPSFGEENESEVQSLRSDKPILKESDINHKPNDEVSPMKKTSKRLRKDKMKSKHEKKKLK